MPRMTSGLRRKYNAHINSAKWRNLRREVVRMRGLRCERCGRLKGRLCLHHLSYARFGNETPDQVQLLCCKCHKPADQERREKRVMPEQSATVLNFEAHRLHALKRAGSELIWFVLADVCEILGIENARNVAARLDDDQKGVHTMYTPGGRQVMVIVSEDAAYEIANDSRKPIAKRFKRWLYREVLPEIRRTGGYEGGAAPLDALIGEMQLALPIGEPVRENVVELPIIDPVREEAELEAELQKYNAEFGYETALPKGLVAVDEKQRQRYLEAWRARNRGCNQLRDDPGPQLCYGPAGTLVEKYDV